MKDGHDRQEDGGEDLFLKKEIKETVEELWATVFQNSNRVLHQAKKYGFLGIELIPSPNIHEMLISLQLASAYIDVLLTNSVIASLDHDSTRQLLNAKEQVTNMERLAFALKANDRDDYDRAVEALRRQAPF
ncbi:hypothetical protein [Achromobacter mucicolens]|uniref:hypothetical protein n=1 Tax=Achromobacter mucicolens TaxID=1389922 RepID=UPI002449097F|nr:hypothetical protein [Achromobacter mucicolens]MDH1522520.1 hypothetical protein [Achromobacter mucicolens]